MKRPRHRLILRPLGLAPKTPRQKKRRHYLGFTEAATRTIELDPRTKSVPLAQVYLHELIHLAHPSWAETRVLSEERRRWKRMSWREKAELYKALGRAKIKDVDDD